MRNIFVDEDGCCVMCGATTIGTAEIGVDPGETIVSSKDLHLYDFIFKLGECLRGKTIKEFRKG